MGIKDNADINFDPVLESMAGIFSKFHQSSQQSVPSSLFLDKKTFENFKVTEINSKGIKVTFSNLLEIKKSLSKIGGLFSYHILWKKGIDTPQAVKQVARILNIPSDWISYAGLKDAQAITSQLISIWSPEGMLYPATKTDYLEISPGFLQLHELSYGQLFGNHFEIKLQTEQLLDAQSSDYYSNLLEKIKIQGIPNFFGLQRFGSVRPISHFIGKAILLNKWKEAVFMYLGCSSPYEQPYIQEIRKQFSETLNFEELNKQIPRKFVYEKKMSKILSRSNNYQRALFSLSPTILSLYIAAYQSFIFNWLLSKTIKKQKLIDFTYKKLPIIGFQTDLTKLPEDIRKEIKTILERDSLSLESFKQIDYRIVKKGATRVSLIHPTDFDYKIEPDAITLYFSLQKGRYGTMLLREILSGTNQKQKDEFEFKTYDEYLKFVQRHLSIPSECRSLID